MGIRIVRRSKKVRGTTGERFDETLGCVELKPDHGCGLLRKVRVREGMIPDLMPLRHDAANEIGVPLTLIANNEKRCLHAAFFQDIKNLRCPFRVGAVIKGNRHMIRFDGSLPKQRRVRWRVFIIRQNPTFGIR